MQTGNLLQCSTSDIGILDLESHWNSLIVAFPACWAYKKSMKAIAFVLLSLCLAGCAESKYASHPQAALIGPGYLETVAKHPPDRATQYYYPGFSIRDFELSADASLPLPKPNLSPEIVALLTNLRQPTQQVKDITGKGYPCLEKTGMRLFTKADQESTLSRK